MESVASQLSVAVFALIATMLDKKHSGHGLMPLVYNLNYARWGLEGVLPPLLPSHALGAYGFVHQTLSACSVKAFAALHACWPVQNSLQGMLMQGCMQAPGRMAPHNTLKVHACLCVLCPLRRPGDSGGRAADGRVADRALRDHAAPGHERGALLARARRAGAALAPVQARRAGLPLPGAPAAPR